MNTIQSSDDLFATTNQMTSNIQQYNGPTKDLLTKNK